MSKFIAVLLLAIGLVGSPSLGWGASGSSKFTNGGTVALNEDLQDVPDSLTALATTDTWVYQMTVVNTGGSAITFTVQDRASSPKYLFVVSIPAGSTYVIAFPEGQKMKGGLGWGASSPNSLVAAIKAKRIP